MKNKLLNILVPLLFVVSRLPLLGYDMFNTDVFKWKARIFDFGSGIFYLDFVKTIQKYHPGVALMWPGTIAVKIFNFYYEYILGKTPEDNNIKTVFELHFVQKLVVILVISITLWFIFNALKKEFGKTYALLAVFLISVEPFYVALTRVLHLEGLMTTFMLASFVWYYHYLSSERTKKTLFISAFFAGLAILTKTTAVFLLPFVGLTTFIFSYQMNKEVQKALKVALSKGLLWFLFTLMIYVVLWPGVWVAPQLVLETLTRGVGTIGIERGHGQIFLGKYVEDPGVFYYPVVFWLRSSIFLLAGLVGFAFLCCGKFSGFFSKKKKQFALFATLFAVFYAIELTIPSKKLDRYLLPSIVSLVLVAAFFYEKFISLFPKKTFTILALTLALPLVQMIYWHPNYFAYYNYLGGGLKKGVFLIEPKWAFGQQELTKYFLEVLHNEGLETFAEGESYQNIGEDALEDKLTVAFPERYYTQLDPFIKKIGGWGVIESLTAESKHANFFVYPVWDDFSSEEARFKLEFIDTIQVHEVDIYNVYRRIP